LAFCASGSFMAQFSNFLTFTLYLFTRGRRSTSSISIWCAEALLVRGSSIPTASLRPVGMAGIGAYLVDSSR